MYLHKIFKVLNSLAIGIYVDSFVVKTSSVNYELTRLLITHIVPLHMGDDSFIDVDSQSPAVSELLPSFSTPSRWSAN